MPRSEYAETAMSSIVLNGKVLAEQIEAQLGGRVQRLS
jgi:hypothetical protein